MPDPAKNDAELIPGMVLGGKYRLEEEIGRGAMGTVWRATHETLEQRVAVKVISQEHAASEELRRRFDTEARAAAKLRSRFVVGVYDNGMTQNGLPYIVMEYLEGECLEDRIARLGSISVAETARIARHVSRALAKAHSHGIVHRDLKPANIFITKSEDEEDGDDWTAKVLDFGIAKMDDFGDRSTTKTGTVLGTPLFMSPEQVRGASDVDARADIYSFGMVVYNMLTGTYAFEGQSFGDLLVSICSDPLPELSRSAPSAPPALNAWFQKVCARDVNVRYQTADEAMSRLMEALGDVAPSARMSLVDSSANLFTPLAETYAANTALAESGSREISSTSMGAAAMTISEPQKKSARSYVLGGAAACIALALFLLVGAGEHDSTEADEASRAAADPAPHDAHLPESEDAKGNAAQEENAEQEAKPRTDALTDEPVENPVTATEEPTVVRAKGQPSPVQPPAPAPVTSPRPQALAPRSTPEPKAAAPAAPPKPKASAPAPAPAPKPSLDLGF